MKDVLILTGAGQIGMAIARRMGHGKKIVVGDKSPDNAGAVCKILNEASKKRARNNKATTHRGMP